MPCADMTRKSRSGSPRAGPRQSRGREGFRQVWLALHDPWDADVRPEEVIDVGDRALVSGQATMRGKGSGIDVSVPFFVLYTLRAGRIIGEQYFNGRAEALEAAGLRE